MALLDDNRLFSTDPILRDRARALYNEVRDLPIISPHGHTDPKWFARNQAFQDPAELFVTPDHYLFRMLHSQGIPLEAMGIPRADGGETKQDPAKSGVCLPRISICSVAPRCAFGSSMPFNMCLAWTRVFQAKLQMRFMTR